MPFPSTTKNNLTPQKSGEIFRNELGQFSFSCTFCHVVSENCHEIMGHINLHFDEKNSMSKSPEVIYIDDADSETKTETSNAFQKVSSVSKTNSEMLDAKCHRPQETKIVRIFKLLKTQSQTKTNNERVSSVSKTKSEIPISDCKVEATVDELESPEESKIVRIFRLPKTRCRTKTNDKRISVSKTTYETPHAEEHESNDCEATVDTTESSQKTKIVRIIKLKPVKIRPHLKTCTGENKPLSNVDQKRSLTTRNDLVKKNPPSETIKNCLQIEPALPELPKYVHKAIRSGCYQCEMEPKMYSPDSARRHKCLFCELWFPNHGEFQIHVAIIHKKNANIVKSCDFYCYVCEKKFAFRNHLVPHLKRHISKSEHLCATCGLRFLTNSKLTQHMKIHEDRTYECDQCGKIFKRFERLRKHFWIHSTDLSFVCKFCSKAFKVKRYLDRHMAIHNDAKIPCRYCDASFNFASVRRAHEQSKHNVL